MRVALLLMVLAMQALGAERPARSAVVKADFIRLNPCPANGSHRLPCPGFEVDHIRALCDGGDDAIENMQWLAKPSHLQKSKEDWATCRATRGRVNPPGWRPL